MYTPRGRARAARPPRHQPARLGRDLARLPRRQALPQRRGRDLEVAELLDQALDPAGSGWAWTR